MLDSPKCGSAYTCVKPLSLSKMLSDSSYAPPGALLTSTGFWASGHLAYPSLCEAKWVWFCPATWCDFSWVQSSDAFRPACTIHLCPSALSFPCCPWGIRLCKTLSALMHRQYAMWGVYTQSLYHWPMWGLVRVDTFYSFFPPQTQQFVSFLVDDSRRWNNKLHMIPSNGHLDSMLLFTVPFFPTPPLLSFCFSFPFVFLGLTVVRKQQYLRFCFGLWFLRNPH